MSTIETIRAEIERINEDIVSNNIDCHPTTVLNDLLSFLSTLEEEPVDLEKEIASFITQFGWGNTKHLAEKELINCTARHFAKWGAEHLKK